MKLRQGISIAAFAISAAAALWGCGNNNNATTNGSCAAGTVPTQYGCVAQANSSQCPSNGQTYGWYNNQCVAVTGTATNYGTYGACAAGQMQTQQYGCQAVAPAGYCPQNGQQYAWVNNQCIPGTVGGYNNNNMYGACSAGQVQTQYGCVAQAGAGQCPQNGQVYGWYNNQCVVGTVGAGGYGNGYGNGYNQCGVGQVMTQYSCLPQQGCPANYGYMNGYCYPAVQSGYNPYGGGGVGGGLYWNFGYGYGNTGCPYGYSYYNGYCVR